MGALVPGVPYTSAEPDDLTLEVIADREEGGGSGPAPEGAELVANKDDPGGYAGLSAAGVLTDTARGDVLNARNYGVLPSNTGLVNRANWSTAVNAAVTAGKPLLIPPGTYQFEMTSLAPYGATPTGDLTIIGGGVGLTVLDCYPKQVSFGSFLLRCTTANTRIQITDLSVLGATSTAAAFADLTATAGFLTYAVNSGTSNDVLLERVNIDAPFWVYGVNTSMGDGVVELNDCDIVALTTCVNVFDSTGDFLNKRFHATDCRFESGIEAADTSDIDPHGICVYLHPHVSTRVRSCDFWNNPRDAIKNFSGGSSTGTPPKYSEFIDCWFHNCTGFTIITPSEDVVTHITGGGADTGSIAVRNDTVITGFQFNGNSGVTGTVQMEPQIELLIDSCIGYWDGDGAIATGDETSVTIRDCTFISLDGSAVSHVSAGTGPRSEVTNCRFVSRTTTADSATGLVVGTALAGCSTVVRGCSFEGRFSTAGIRVGLTRTDASVTISDCDFSRMSTDSGVGVPLSISSASATYGNVVRGRDNVWGTQAITNGGTTTRTRFQLRRATQPTAVASAATVLLDRDHNTFHISGTATIATINVGAAGAEQIRFEGPLYLIADGAFATSAAGNIVPTTTAARHAGEVVSLVWDGIDGKFHETASAVNATDIAAAPFIDSTEVTSLEVLTQAEYDALSPPSATTVYVIQG